MCLSVRERERERVRKTVRETESVCVCVCVCVRLSVCEKRCGGVMSNALMSNVFTSIVAYVALY